MFKNHNNQRRSASKNFIIEYYAKKYNNIKIKVLIVKEQQKHLTFEAFFLNNVFWELGLHLGIKNVLSTNKPVRKSLQEYATVIDFVKAYAMSLYIADKLYSVGEIKDIKENYTAFLSGMFRSMRFGKSSQYANSNVIIFNYLSSKNAIKQNSLGKYSIDYEKMKKAIPELISKVVTIQGNGDYEAANEFINSYINCSEKLQKSLDQLSENQIPIDILFKDKLKVD